LWPRNELRGALLWAALLAGYGNVLNAVAWWGDGSQRGDVGLLAPLGLVAVVLAWHWRVDRRGLAELGLHGQGWRRGAAWGAAAGVAMAVPPLVYFLLPGPAGAPLRFDEVQGIGPDALLRRLLVTTLVLVALVEEVVFRGFLQGKLGRALPARPWAAVVLSSLAFAIWHVGVTLRTLQQTNVGSAGFMPVAPALALVWGLLAVFVAGLVFGALYQRTGSLTAPVLAHWLVDALMLLALYQPPPT
jgi:membrane protease YdiL (CAAX protease family)